MEDFTEDENLESDIEDCFSYIKDRGGYVKVDSVNGVVGVRISVDSLLKANHETKLSKYNARYRPVIEGDQIVEEIVDGISKCVGVYGLEISTAQITWVQAGEWVRKMGYKPASTAKPSACLLTHRLCHLGRGGPGFLEKGFKEGAKDGNIDPIEKGAYSIESINKILLEKGDRVRTIKIYFK